MPRYKGMEAIIKVSMDDRLAEALQCLTPDDLAGYIDGHIQDSINAAIEEIATEDDEDDKQFYKIEAADA